MSDGLNSLPFSSEKQMAVLGHGIVNQSFFKEARNSIQAEWFVDPFCAKIWAAKIKFDRKHNRPPTEAELLETPEFLEEDQAVRIKMRTRINESKLAINNFPLDVLGKELTDWLHARIYQTRVKESERLYNLGKHPEAYLLLKKMAKEIDETSFGGDNEVVFDNFIQDWQDAVQQRKDALTFGLSVVDRLLMPEAEGGCFLRGDTTVLLAPTNIGKSTTMINIACANIKRQKSVLFISHEDRKEALRDKIWCCMLGVSQPELFKLYETPEGLGRIQRTLAYINRYLKFVSYNKSGATIEEVEAIIRRKQDERVARYGKPFDMVVDDYPAKLITNLAKGGMFSKRHIDDYVYNCFVQLALEYDSHSLVAIQTNREGSKINKTVTDAKRLLVKEDVQESFGVIQSATNVITLNRDPTAMERNLVTFYIDKSRSSDVGYAVVARSDFARAITHSDELGSYWYRGTTSYTDHKLAEAWLSSYNGKELPAFCFNS